MVADVDARRDDQLLRGIQAIAGQAAAVVADEAAALRIGGVVVQAALLQPEAVRQRVVAAHVLDQDRMDARRLVEVPAGRKPAVGEHLRVHPDGADPVPSGVRSAASAIRATRSAIERDARVARIDRGQLGAGEREVVMRVDEARQDGAALDIDRAGVRWRGGPRRGVAADRR